MGNIFDAITDARRAAARATITNINAYRNARAASASTADHPNASASAHGPSAAVSGAGHSAAQLLKSWLCDGGHARGQ